MMEPEHFTFGGIMSAMKKVVVGCILSSLVLLLPGCGDGNDNGGDGAGGACRDYAGTTECLEYTGAEWVSSSAEFHCQQMMGTHASAVCDQQGIVGRCTINGGDGLAYQHVYYERAAEAETACATNNGTWVAA